MYVLSKICCARLGAAALVEELVGRYVLYMYAFSKIRCAHMHLAPATLAVQLVVGVVAGAVDVLRAVAVVFGAAVIIGVVAVVVAVAFCVLSGFSPEKAPTTTSLVARTLVAAPSAVACGEVVCFLVALNVPAACWELICFSASSSVARTANPLTASSMALRDRFENTYMVPVPWSASCPRASGTIGLLGCSHVRDKGGLRLACLAIFMGRVHIVAVRFRTAGNGFGCRRPA